MKTQNWQRTHGQEGQRSAVGHAALAFLGALVVWLAFIGSIAVLALAWPGEGVK